MYEVLTPAARANEQGKVSKRVENTWKHLNISATMLQNRQVFLSEKERYSNPFARGPLALRMTSSLDARGHYGWLHPLGHGCQKRDCFWPLALWMTSPMDARGHYRWLPKFIHGCQSLWRQKIWSTGHILKKLKSIFNLRHNHSMNHKNGLETYNAYFKLQSRKLLNANLILWGQLSTEN
jgi:hypothetical protein